LPQQFSQPAAGTRLAALRHVGLACTTFSLIAASLPSMARLSVRLAAVALWLAATAQAQVPQLPTLAICVAIKDQAADVREWIIYHRAMGTRD
jgi:hypothetical protein